MHHIYETDAYILKTVPQGEADMFVTCLTKEFGLVRVYAQGLRYEKSKLRFAVQEYARVTVSVVQGKHVWRLTSAQADTLLTVCLSEAACAVVVRIFRLLERLLQGEATNTALFEVVDAGCAVLQEPMHVEQYASIETMMVLRILYHLGYIDGTKVFQPIISSCEYNNALQTYTTENQRMILDAINHALKESHL